MTKQVLIKPAPPPPSVDPMLIDKVASVHFIHDVMIANNLVNNLSSKDFDFIISKDLILIVDKLTGKKYVTPVSNLRTAVL